MATKRVQNPSDLKLANAINAARRRCRIGKVTPKSVAMGARAFRDVLAEKMPDDFRRRYCIA